LKSSLFSSNYVQLVAAAAAAAAAIADRVAIA